MFYKNLARPHEPGLASHCPLCGDWSQGQLKNTSHCWEYITHWNSIWVHENTLHSGKYCSWYIAQLRIHHTNQLKIQLMIHHTVWLPDYGWRIHHTVDHTLDYIWLTGKYHKSWRLTVLHDSICKLYIFNWLSFQTFKIWQCPCGQIYFAWQLTTDQPEPPVVLLLSC